MYQNANSIHEQCPYVIHISLFVCLSVNIKVITGVRP